MMAIVVVLVEIITMAELVISVKLLLISHRWLIRRILRVLYVDQASWLITRIVVTFYADQALWLIRRRQFTLIRGNLM